MYIYISYLVMNFYFIFFGGELGGTCLNFFSSDLDGTFCIV
jgi:hypothetical protein